MPATDFDFLPGTWQVRNRKLTDALDPACDAWEEFASTWETRAMLGGGGNVDHIHAPGWEGLTLRLHDPGRASVDTATGRNACQLRGRSRLAPLGVLTGVEAHPERDGRGVGAIFVGADRRRRAGRAQRLVVHRADGDVERLGQQIDAAVGGAA